MARHREIILGFDDLRIGDEWESAGRTITETDVVMFAGLSGDFNALHVDHARAERGPFGKPVAHGLLGLAVSSGLGSHAPRVDTLAFLAILEWRFLRPVAFGDTLRVVATVEAIEPQSRGRRATVTWRRQLLNQNDQVVQEGRTQTLVRARSAAAPEAEAETEDAGPKADADG